MSVNAPDQTRCGSRRRFGPLLLLPSLRHNCRLCICSLLLPLLLVLLLILPANVTHKIKSPRRRRSRSCHLKTDRGRGSEPGGQRGTPKVQSKLPTKISSPQLTFLTSTHLNSSHPIHLASLQSILPPAPPGPAPHHALTPFLSALVVRRPLLGGIIFNLINGPTLVRSHLPASYAQRPSPSNHT